MYSQPKYLIVSQLGPTDIDSHHRHFDAGVHASVWPRRQKENQTVVKWEKQG